MSKEVVTGLNILKKGQDPPLRPDDQLPEWLWQLAQPDKTLNELRRTKEEDLTPSMVRLPACSTLLQHPFRCLCMRSCALRLALCLRKCRSWLPRLNPHPNPRSPAPRHCGLP